MLSKVRIFLTIFCFIASMNVVFGNDILEFRDILRDEISLSDKIEYLESIKGNYFFSKMEINMLVATLYKYQTNNYWETEKDKGNGMGQLHKDTPEDVQLKNKLKIVILEILLRRDLNEMVFNPAFVIETVWFLGGEIGGSEFDEDYKTRRYLALKLLIKLNEIKPKTSYTETVMWHWFQSYPGMYHEDRKGWGHKDMIEDYIFDPILLEIGFDYVEKDQKTLKDYERYLLDHLKAFPITDNMQKLVERAFYKTQFVEFKSEYIDAMFYLEMKNTLLRIILDDTVDSSLRQHAMEVGIKLLKETNLLNFNWFAYSLLKSMKQVSSNLDQKEELRKIVEEKIESVESIIANRDRVKDLERVIFDTKISLEEKIKYLKIMIYQGFSIPKKDLGIVKNIFDSRDLDIRIKVETAYMVLYGNKSSDILEVLSKEDIDTISFLYDVYMEHWTVDEFIDSLKLYNAKIIKHIIFNKISSFDFMKDYVIEIDPTVEERFRVIANIINEKSGENFIDSFILNKLKPLIKDMEINTHIRTNNSDIIERIKDISVKDLCNIYYRLDEWNMLVNYIESLEVSCGDSDRKVAILTALNLLTKTKNFDEFSSSFLQALQNISDNRRESVELRNIADYILLKVENGELSLKEGGSSDCVLKFLL